MDKLITILVAAIMPMVCLADQSLVGDCYQTTMRFQKPDNKNILTVCVNNNKVLERMIYENDGRLAAVCYQSGSLSKVDGNTVLIKYTNGACVSGQLKNNKFTTAVIYTN